MFATGAHFVAVATREFHKTIITDQRRACIALMLRTIVRSHTRSSLRKGPPLRAGWVTATRLTG
jgi:hypothetical protein